MAQATSDEDEDKDGAERHIVYAFALMAAALIQVVGAVTLHVRPISLQLLFSVPVLQKPCYGLKDTGSLERPVHAQTAAA